MTTPELTNELIAKLLWDTLEIEDMYGTQTILGMEEAADKIIAFINRREAKLRGAIQQWADADSYETDQLANNALIEALRSCEYRGND